MKNKLNYIHHLHHLHHLHHHLLLLLQPSVAALSTGLLQLSLWMFPVEAAGAAEAQIAGVYPTKTLPTPGLVKPRLSSAQEE